jgi:hypothetical protein
MSGKTATWEWKRECHGLCVLYFPCRCRNCRHIPFIAKISGFSLKYMEKGVVKLCYTGKEGCGGID